MNSPSETVKEIARVIVEHLDALEPGGCQEQREALVADIIHLRLMEVVNNWTPDVKDG